VERVIGISERQLADKNPSHVELFQARLTVS
jgi:hypothetical protein